MYNDNQNNPQDFRQTGRGSRCAHGMRGGMRGGMNATDDMPQDGQGMGQNGQGMGMGRRHGGNGGRGRNGMGQNGQGMGQNCQGMGQRRSGKAMTQRSTPPDAAPASPTGDGTDD